MTSKEALIILFASYNYNGNYQEVIEAREKIEKDLEVLEILKKNIYVADNMIYANPKELNSDDYNKLKEWYENGKINN